MTKYSIISVVNKQYKKFASVFIQSALQNLNLDNIVTEACLMYALSCTRTKGEAALLLGLREDQFRTIVKKFKIENYFKENLD